MKLAVVSILCGWVSIAAAQPGAGAPPPPPGGGGYAYPAQPGYEDPSAHRHDSFFLRLWIGPAYTSMKLEDADVEVSGGGGSFGIAVGTAVQENLIIFGQLFDDIAMNPTIKMGGAELETSDVNAGVIGVGAGLAYYIMPANVYVSGALTYTQISVQQDGQEIGESEFGPGFSLMIGKEWWVSNNWGVGGALQLFGGRMKDKGDGAPTWQTTAAALVFSATYN